MPRREATKDNQTAIDRPCPGPRHRRRARSPLARLNTTSLYETCATALNREIETGALRPGQRLPSERSLGDALGFTRLTVRRALQVLAQRGLLEPDERRGWQVRSGQVSDSLSTLMGFTQMARMRGLVATLSHPFARVPRRDFRRVGSIAGGARRADAGSFAIAPAR